MQAVKVMLPVKTVKHLFAAEGYLELGMPQYALNELAAIDDPNPVEASVEYLSGEAFRQQERYDDAVKSLERAARLIPEPHNKVVWESLSDCFRKNGDEELAEIAAIIASETGADMEEIDFDNDYDFDADEPFREEDDDSFLSGDFLDASDEDDDWMSPWQDRWS